MKATEAGYGANRGVRVTRLQVTGSTGTIVSDLDFSIPKGSTLAIIGESGSGKSMTARALTGLLPRGTNATGDAEINGFRFDLAARQERAWQQVRGRRAVLLLQDPFTSLSHVLRCGDQIGYGIRARLVADGSRVVSRTVRDEVMRRLEEVRLPAHVARRYPFELSGGMRQRVAIAAALSTEPSLLIADEPTTALDASTQGEVLDLLNDLQEAHQMSLLLISHDLGIIEGRANEVLVMRQGEVVERGKVADVLNRAEHPYTKQLIAANPSLAEVQPPGEAAREPILSAKGLNKSFGSHSALVDADIDVAAGEIVAVVGESGSGKSTLARSIAGLEIPDAGATYLEGRRLPEGRRGRKPSEIQIVFQDPYSTLNPSFTVEQTLHEAIRFGGTGGQTVADLLRLVDLDVGLAKRRPSQLSGGQRQRVAIARALAPQPRLLICDESVSALDVSVQAQVLELLAKLRDEFGIAMLFITHDLSVVARIANRVVVLRRGEIVERGTAKQVLQAPQHSYTRMLVDAAERDSISRHVNGSPSPVSKG